MKSFKKFVAEVAQPKPEEEKRFKDQHTYEVIKHPVATDAQFTGDIDKPKAKRIADQEGDANYDKAVKNPERRMAAESVEDGESEQIDEISKALAGRYLKKVPASAADAGDKIGRSSANQAGASADVRKGYEKDRKKGIKTFLNRQRGTELAVAKLTGKAKQNATESNADDRARYDAADDKNKKKVTLPKAPWDKKDEELSPKQKKIDHNKNGKIDGHDLAMLRKKKNEEVEQIDETTSSAVKKMVTQTGSDGKTRTVMKKAKMDKTDDRGQDQITTRESAEQIDEISKDMADRYVKKAMPQYKRAQDKQHVGTFGSATQKGADANKERLRKRHKGIGSVQKRLGGSELTRKDPKKHTMTGKPAPYQHESVEMIDEAMKMKRGPMRLKDGTQIMVSKEDADLLNRMFKDLSSNNQRQMQKVMMMDKAGYEEISGFAREAL